MKITVETTQVTTPQIDTPKQSDTTGPTVKCECPVEGHETGCPNDLMTGLLQSIRSAELPVEPEPMPEMWLAAHRLPAGFKLYTQKTIDALKSYALKEKERADEAIRAIDKIQQVGLLHLERAEKAESELAALRGKLMEPDDEMIKAGYPPNDESAQSWGVVEVFKAMSAVALKEGE